MNRVRKLCGLSHSERRYLLCATVLLPSVAGGLRLIGLSRTQSVLARLARVTRRLTGGALDPARAQAMERMVRIAAGASRLQTRCLQRSLVLWFLMHAGGLQAEIWFGVSKDANGVNAHAWVEYDGQVLNDTSGVRDQFAAFKPAMS